MKKRKKTDPVSLLIGIVLLLVVLALAQDLLLSYLE